MGYCQSFRTRQEFPLNRQNIPIIMRRLVIFEWAIILIALFSLLPAALGYRQPMLYRVYLIIIMLALIWVTRNRVLRTRQAAEEAQRKHDEMTGRGSKPMM